MLIVSTVHNQTVVIPNSYLSSINKSNLLHKTIVSF